MSDRYPGGIIVANPTAPTTTSAPGIWTLEQASYYIGQGTWPLQPVPDPYYEYVTMLLPGNGTNGAQNNTFLDSSTNALSITRQGNTTQGSFSPYGSLWSNYFNGSNTYLSPPANTAFAFGTNAFTIEGWFYSNSSSASQSIADNYNGEGAGSDGTVGIVALYAGNIRFTSITSVYLSYAYTANQWNHFAIVRSGTTLSLFLNGSRVATTTNSSNFTSTTSYKIGAEYNSSTYSNFFSGNLSNIRLVKGTAVYDPSLTTITVPTTSLTAVSGTSLLTCQSNRFIDNSSNSFALTVGGTPSVQRFSPFNPTASYSTATIGGSVPMSSTGGILKTGPSSAFAFGTGAYTIEFWWYATNVSLDQYVFYRDGGEGWYVLGHGSALYFGRAGVAVTHTTANGVIKLNQWNHVVFCRGSTSAGEMACFVNGVRVNLNGSATSTDSRDWTQTDGLLVGGFYGWDLAPNGYITDVRLVKRDVYGYSNSTITVPSAPLTAVADTSFLCNMTNAGIPDLAMMNDLETVGNAQVSTSVKKFGTGSISFDGTGDYLKSSADTSLYTFGTGDFTVEFWMYLNNTSSAQVIFDMRPTSTNGVYPDIYFDNSGNTLNWFISSANRITSSSISATTWYHVAVARSGTSTKMFINGTQAGSTYTDTNNYLCGSNRPVVGINATDLSVSAFNGYIDDLRITKGYARYTANFTPPTAALPTF